MTNQMKAECMGEFTFLIEEPCPKCALHLDDHYDDISCLCDGDVNENDAPMYMREITVPWDTCKEIYKKMYAADHGPAG